MKRRKNILIVEDERYIAEAEKLILENDFDVHLAKDGIEGLDKMKRIRPDVVILDIMLPKMDGFQLCQKIREDKTLKNTKIVMVTSKNQEADEEYGMDTGADDYIMKPFEPAELMHVINQVLK
jgi:DNA-binding response OmpR family regulator